MDFPDINNEYPLGCQYNIWSHSTNNRDWRPTSYTLLHTFESLKEFFDFFQKHPNPQLGMFFIMKDPIVPTWEDVHNAPGGCWSFKVNNKKNYKNTWLHLAAALVGNTLTLENAKMTHINGISLTIRKHNIVIKIWMNDCENDVKIIRSDLPSLDLDNSIFQKHEGRG